MELRADTTARGGDPSHRLRLGDQSGGPPLVWTRGAGRGEVSGVLLYRRGLPGAGALLPARHPRHALSADRPYDPARLLLGHLPAALVAGHPWLDGRAVLSRRARAQSGAIPDLSNDRVWSLQPQHVGLAHPAAAGRRALGQ